MPAALLVTGLVFGMVSTKLVSSSNLGTQGKTGLPVEPHCEALTQIDPQAAPDVLHF